MEVQERVPVQVLPLVLRKGLQGVLEQVVSRGRGILRRAMLLRIPAPRVRSVSRRVGQKAVRREGPRGVHLGDLKEGRWEGLMVAQKVGHLGGQRVGRKEVRMEGPRAGL